MLTSPLPQGNVVPLPEKRPTHAVKLVIIDHDWQHCLLGFHPDKGRHGLYESLGGRGYAHHTPHQTAVKECYEEAGPIFCQQLGIIGKDTFDSLPIMRRFVDAPFGQGHCTIRLYDCLIRMDLDRLMEVFEPSDEVPHVKKFPIKEIFSTTGNTAMHPHLPSYLVIPLTHFMWMRTADK